MEVEVETSSYFAVPHDDDLINYDSDIADNTIISKDQDVQEIIENAVVSAPDVDEADDGHMNGTAEDTAEPTDAFVDDEGNEAAYFEEADQEVVEHDEGEPGDAEPGDAEPGDAEPGDAEPGDAEQELDASHREAEYAAEDEPVEAETDASTALESNVHADQSGFIHEQQEIGWEDDVEYDESNIEVPDELHTAGEASDMPAFTDGAEIETEEARHEELDGGNEAGAQSVEAEASSEHGPTAVVQESSELHGNHTENEHQHSPQSHPEFPSITVHYKGDDFPFFSGSSDGFFFDVAVLEGSIKSLLEGFRAELSNELMPDEDLVFQIDELGLEFAESSSDDILHGTTLRQAMDVFDILVKNQDPDGTRTLYTYLFTRPSISKRLEYLMESAAEGRGLDEVIHLFHPPTQLAESHAEENGDAFGGSAAELTDVAALQDSDPNQSAPQGDSMSQDESHDTGVIAEDPNNKGELTQIEEADTSYVGNTEGHTSLPADNGIDAADVDDAVGAVMADLEDSEQAGIGNAQTRDDILDTEMNVPAPEAVISTTIEDHVTANSAGDVDDLDEIDWRENLDDQPEDGSADTSSVAVKRGHGDAELDDDNGTTSM